MRQAFAVLTVVTILAAASARAEDPLRFEVKAAQQPCITGIKGDVCHHFFENDKVRVSFTAPLMKANEGCPRMTAELVQLSARLEAPLKDSVSPAEAGLCESRAFEAQLPALVHETEFEIVFRRETEKGKWENVKTVALKAYPRTLLDGVKSWAEFKGNALVVKDKEGRLADFLDRHKVAYQTQDIAGPDGRKLHIVTGKDAEDVEGDAIYLREKVDIFPLVKIRQTAQQTTANVKTRLLEALSADDPLAQKTFVEIFNEIAK